MVCISKSTIYASPLERSRRPEKRDVTFELRIVANACVHTIPEPLLDPLHLARTCHNRTASAFKGPELVERQARAVLEPVRLREAAPDELSTGKVTEVTDVGMREQPRHVPVCTACELTDARDVARERLGRGGLERGVQRVGLPGHLWNFE